jgi:hypothetical protein
MDTGPLPYADPIQKDFMVNSLSPFVQRSIALKQFVLNFRNTIYGYKQYVF